MDKISSIMNELLEPVGGKARSFIIDYWDDSNNYFSTDASVIQPPGVAINPADLTDGLILPFEAKGYTVYSVAELLDGFTEAQFTELAKLDPAEARKHVATVYLDFRKE